MRCYSGFLFLGILKLLPRVDGGCQWLTGFGESNSLPFLLPWSVDRPMSDVRHSWLHSIAPFFVSQESLLATLSFAVCGMGRHSHALGMPLSVPSGMGNALIKVNVLAWMLCVGETNTVWKSSYIDQTQYFQNPLSTELPARGIRLWVPRPLLELQLWVPQAVTPTAESWLQKVVQLLSSVLMLSYCSYLRYGACSQSPRAAWLQYHHLPLTSKTTFFPWDSGRLIPDSTCNSSLASGPQGNPFLTNTVPCQYHIRL